MVQFARADPVNPGTCCGPSNACQGCKLASWTDPDGTWYVDVPPTAIHQCTDHPEKDQNSDCIVLVPGFVLGQYKGECWWGLKVPFYMNNQCDVWKGEKGDAKYGTNYCKLKANGGQSDPCP